MKFKIDPNSDLFKKLQALSQKIRECDRAAIELTEKLGFKAHHPKGMLLAGGIYGLVPKEPKTKPDGYAWAFDDKNCDAVMPTRRTREGKAIWRSIEELPVVEYDELNKLVNYSRELSAVPNGNGATRMSFCPAVNWSETQVVIDIPWRNKKLKYKPAPGMIEITESEYDSIIEKIQVERKVKRKRAKAKV